MRKRRNSFSEQGTPIQRGTKEASPEKIASEREEQEWTRRIQSDLSRLEDESKFPVPLPDLPSLENWIIEQQQVLKRKLIRDLLLFWLFALLILSAIVSIAYRNPVFFLYLQAPVLLTGVIGFFLAGNRRKRVNRI
ncbi:MAG: hypothetical protein K0R67_964 [Paenibacillus sp.]|jgi:hypothetical protein|nr:hypothetical protein [Paenibacillus sp.]